MDRSGRRPGERPGGNHQPAQQNTSGGPAMPNFRQQQTGVRGDGRYRGDIPEWQRETWVGPNPAAADPFDEPESAPELRDQRSDSLNDRRGGFWQDQPTGGYRYTGGQNTRPETQITENTPVANTAAENTAATDKRGGKRRAALLITVLLLIGLCVALRLTVFSVRVINVIGNVNYTREQIIAGSGVKYGMNLLTLDGDKVERTIESDYHLQFRYMEKKMPGEIVLCVREREAMAYLNYCGIFYTLDKSGMVLFESELTGIEPASLTELKGLEIRNIRCGQTISLAQSAQKQILESLFLEIKVLGCGPRVASADLTTPDNMYLTLRSGFSVSLGNTEQLHMKLRSMLLVEQKLIELGYTSGTIRVSAPTEPTFTPDTV